MIHVNLNYWIKRLIGRATCEMADHVRLLPSARICNARGANQHICIGQYSIIRGELFVFAHGGQINIGTWCYVGEGSRIWSSASIDIGDRVLISHNVNIFDNITHPLSARARHEQFVSIATKGHPKNLNLGEKPVIIKPDALIAAGATILRGVTVGQGAIVGAGSVVTKDVPAFCIVAGNPARIIRELNKDER